MLTSSTFTEGVVQEDGRRYINELHIEQDGRAFVYEWLSDGTLDPQLVLEERAAVINSTLAAREAARVAVVGTEVPISKHDFLDRFAPAERIAIRIESRTNDAVLDFMEMLNAADVVHMALARPGLDYLVSIGKLTAARAAAIGVS